MTDMIEANKATDLEAFNKKMEELASKPVEAEKVEGPVDAPFDV